MIRIWWNFRYFYNTFKSNAPEINPIDLEKNRMLYSGSFLPVAAAKYGINGPRPVIMHPYPIKDDE